MGGRDIYGTGRNNQRNNRLRSGLPISSIREGEVFGIHTVRYESDIDSISITHDAKNRGGFVLGAILAAEYTAHHEGFLGMKNLFPFLNE